MRRYLLGVAIAIAITTAACGSGGQPAASSSATPTSASPSTAPPPATGTTTEPAPLPAEPVQPGAVGVSPGGVTTKVDVPADATESGYGQACHAAKVWMDEQQGDPQTLVEPYLKVLQTPGSSGPGTFNTPWAQLTPAQQSGVIIAVNGAANGECA
jgi:Putative lipoprotein LpqV